MDTKFCPRCDETKPVAEFSRNKARANRDGLASYCKLCVREYGRKYDKARWENNKAAESERHRKFVQSRPDIQEKYRQKAARYRKENPAKVNATNRARSKHRFVPAWADREAMTLVYQKAVEWSERLGTELQVDHIVPLRGKTVCGLHCEANLQLLQKDLNHAKRHFAWPDMPD